MRTEDVANLTLERILFDIERVILPLKGLRTITLAGGFDKSDQQPVEKLKERFVTLSKILRPQTSLLR
jgi:hypothetical protein